MKSGTWNKSTDRKVTRVNGVVVTDGYPYPTDGNIFTVEVTCTASVSIDTFGRGYYCSHMHGSIFNIKINDGSLHHYPVNDGWLNNPTILNLGSGSNATAVGFTEDKWILT